MNKILWYLTNKLDASFFLLSLFLFQKRCTVLLCSSDMITMCTKTKKSDNSKRGRVRNTITFVFILF